MKELAADLIKKGLRHQPRTPHSRSSKVSRRPDQKGIETLNAATISSQFLVSRRPDQKGIETLNAATISSQFLVSRRPDQKGIETPRGNALRVRFEVSRRPDQKGIETRVRFGKRVAAAELAADLIKKGLRPRFLARLLRILELAADLIKKGLRPRRLTADGLLQAVSRRPDQKGIETLKSHMRDSRFMKLAADLIKKGLRPRLLRILAQPRGS